jgi:hypothetical protein
LLLAACATPPVASSAPHQHLHTTTVTIDERGLMPASEVHVPVFSTVVWRNRRSEPATIDVAATACPECETVLGFTAAPDGAHSSAIAPDGLATLCFHTAGTFAFVVKVGASEQRGTIVVEGTP